MKHIIKFAFISLLPIFCISCQEEITIDTETGDQLIGIYGGITTEYKQHTITISKTADFYSTADIEMISSATCSIVDVTDNDTIPLHETNNGIYATDSVCGKIGHSYKLMVSLLDKGGELKEFYAQSYIDVIPDQIDSAKILPVTTLFGETLKDNYKVCPFFKTSVENIYYMIKLRINDKLVSDTLTDVTRLHMGNLSGLYYNGSEMKMLFEEMNTFPLGVYNLDQENEAERIKINDLITIELFSIPKAYYNYIGDIENSMGSNPMMGSPTNVRTNICCDNGKTVGQFYAASHTFYTFQVK